MPTLERLAADAVRQEEGQAIQHTTAEHLARPFGLQQPPEAVPLIGRAAELAALLSWHQRAGQRQGALVIVEAPSGVGKSRLLEELRRRLHDEPGLLVFGQGRAQVGQHPLESLEPVLEALGADKARLREVTRAVAPWVAALQSSHPRARELFPASTGVTGEQALPTVRVDEAWVHLLNAAGAPGAPLTLVLDDAQWLDAQSLQVVRRWWREQPLEGSAACVVLGVRAGDQSALAGLLEGEVSQWLKLEALGAAESAQLSRALLGELPAEVQRRLYALSEGNAFLLGALAQGLARHGAAHGWSRLDLDASEALAWLDAPGRGAQLLHGLLEGLPEHGAALLEAAALLGRSFDVAAAARMRGLPRRVALRIFREAQEQRLIHLIDEDRATFAHCQLREAALQRLGEEARRQIHAEIARDLVAQGGADPFEVSWHYHAAGQDGAALPFALQAAAQAHQRGALAQSVEHLEIAWAGAGAAPRAQRQEIAQALGARLGARGDYKRARRWLEEARALSDSAEARLALDIQQGELAFKDNDSVQSRRLLEGALRQLGARVPRRAVGFALALLWQLLLRALWRVARGALPPRGPLPPQLARQVEVRRALGYAYNFLNDNVAGLASLLTTLNQLERYEPGPELVSAQTLYTYIQLIMGRHAGAQQTIERARQIAALRRDREVIARVHQVAALVYYTRGELERSLQEADQAAALHERFGNHWDFNVTLYSLGMAQVALGLHAEALKTGLRLLQRALQADEALMIIAGVVLLQRSSQQRLELPAALLGGLYARYDALDAQQQGALLRCMALEALRRGALEEAMALSTRAQPLIHKLRLEYTADGIDAHAEIARRCWEQQREGAPSTRSQREARWSEALRALEGFARQRPVHQPAALRERAWWWAWRGDADKARAALAQAQGRAEALQMAYELARARMARAQIGALLGWPEANRELAEARALLQSVRAPQEQLARAQALLSKAAARP